MTPTLAKAMMCCLCGTYMTLDMTFENSLGTHIFLGKNTCSHVSTCSSHPTWEQPLEWGTLARKQNICFPMLEIFLKY